MLPKRQRLTSSGVQRVLKKPLRVAVGPFRCSWRENTVGYPRCAVVVTKGTTVLGSVERNRIRRVVYAALEAAFAQTMMGVDVVIFLRASPEKILTTNILSHLHSLISSLEEKREAMRNID